MKAKHVTCKMNGSLACFGNQKKVFPNKMHVNSLPKCRSTPARHAANLFHRQRHPSDQRET